MKKNKNFNAKNKQKIKFLKIYSKGPSFQQKVMKRFTEDNNKNIKKENIFFLGDRFYF